MFWHPVLSGGGARRLMLASAAILASVPAVAQTSAPPSLPPVTVEPPQRQRINTARTPQRAATRAARVPSVRSAPPAAAPVASDLARGPALTVLTVQQALRDIQQTPGGVAIVPAEAYKNSTVANTIKDILDYVPGVFAQPKWGDDTRLSIRGSGLSRNFHLRGVQLYMDGIPINTADGYGDFQEIDPTAYKYVAVYKGANALQFGANALGGAINFVTPTGRDPFPNGVSADLGGFGFRRLQANAGGANGPWDGFITASTQAAEGFRDHSFGQATRVSGNVGYQFSPDFETRFYLNANEVRQRIPGQCHEDDGADFARDRGSDKRSQRLATQPRYRSHRQQKHHPPRQQRHRFRRLWRRSPPDASDLPMARLPLPGLRRICQGHRRPHHRRLPQQVCCRLQHPQRHHRRPAIRQCWRAQGDADVILAAEAGKLFGLCGKFASTSSRTSR